MVFSSMLRWTKKKMPSINLKPPPAHPHRRFHCKNPHIAVWVHTCLTVHHSLFQTPTIICSINQPETSSFFEKGAKFGVCSTRSTHLCGSRVLCGGRKAAVLLQHQADGACGEGYCCLPNQHLCSVLGRIELHIWGGFDQCCFFLLTDTFYACIHKAHSTL